MPHLKCEPCRLRVQRVGEAAAPGDPCPLCERPLEPVGQLSEIVGFRWVGVDGASPATAAPNAGYERLAASVAEITARRRAVDGRALLHTKRWAP
jgi:hypothetical protein